MSRRNEDRDEPVSLTSVPEPRSDEVDRRWHVYVIQMIVRIGCFVGALFARGPLQIVLIVGAVVLPYTAVIFANASGERRSTTVSEVDLPAIGSAPEAAPPVVIEQVEVVDEQPDARAEEPDAQPGSGRPGEHPHDDGHGPARHSGDAA
ncbi:DUF3099 domain-containing protein [Luteimicrobium subarcticum]|uniref:DUF3099 family protein n=1 Tax=Luteimicrobium subarcticum TaxID=620910 RepID=A0A2M8WWJ9_9MICO|nr:DUF3099 domain-containing protein [Luteimicrobium subarcticum]PJI95256.1 Protein of unknown function (DUF3099) [Luteimicrobium subarcticum]